MNSPFHNTTFTTHRETVIHANITVDAHDLIRDGGADKFVINVTINPDSDVFADPGRPIVKSFTLTYNQLVRLGLA